MLSCYFCFMFCCNYFCYRIYFQFCYCYYCIHILSLFYWLNIDDTFYLSNITKPNHKPNQQIQLQYNDNIFQSWYYFIPCYIIVVLKRIIKGDNKRNERKEGTSSQNSGREKEDFSFCFITSKLHHCRYREAGLLINFFIILLLSNYFTIVLPFLKQYYPLFFTSLYN